MSKAEAVSGQFGPRCDSADGLWSFRNGRRNTLAHATGPGVQKVSDPRRPNWNPHYDKVVSHGPGQQ
jgi:hypothetical protein